MRLRYDSRYQSYVVMRYAIPGKAGNPEDFSYLFGTTGISTKKPVKPPGFPVEYSGINIRNRLAAP